MNNAFESDAVTLDPPGAFRRHPLRPHELTAEVTPTEQCFVLAHLGIPRLDPTSWALRVDGLVRERLMLPLQALREQPRREVTCFHECAGSPLEPTVAQRRIVNVVWGGVSLCDVLTLAGVDPAARYVWSYGADSGSFAGTHSDAYVKDLPVERALAGEVLLAYEINGEPLSPEHGFPLRLLVPGWYGTNSVKWLTRLRLADRRFEGPFTRDFYADPMPGRPAATRPVWAVAPESVIVTPAPGVELRPAPRPRCGGGPGARRRSSTSRSVAMGEQRGAAPRSNRDTSGRGSVSRCVGVPAGPVRPPCWRAPPTRPEQPSP